MARCIGLVLLLAVQAHKVQRNVALRGGAGHHLRVCNAYAYEAAVDILHEEEKLTNDKPLPYRQCHDFHVALKANDKLDFRLGNVTTGSFSVSDVPSKDALLLLVVFRHDVESTAVSFESHVFVSNKAAQVAVIDTFLGTSDFKPVLWNGNQTEKLRFGRVISVKPGKYSIRLQNDANETEGLAAMDTKEGKHYVVLRLGAKAKHGPSFPEELVAFPEEEADIFGRRNTALVETDATNQVPRGKPGTMNATRTLRVCHAFPSDEPLSVAWRDMVLTSDQPLTYKTCSDLPAPQALEVGEELHIGLRNGPSNTFQISELPDESDGTLLLVCFRRGRTTLDLQFQSHAFAPMQNRSAQVAIMDTYDGAAKSDKPELHIGRAGEVNAGGGEEVSFDSIVKVNPGDYTLWLVEDSKSKEEIGFEVESQSSYVVLRVGGEAHESSGGKEFKEELVVFPHTKLNRDRSFAPSRSSIASLLVLLSTWAVRIG